MRADIVQVSPTFFGPGGMVGGGERYPLELSRALSTRASTRLVTFGPEARRLRVGPLKIHVLPTRSFYASSEVNPLSELLPLELVDAKVIHNHQYESVVTNLSIVLARLAGKRVYVTEHGGRGRNFARKYRLGKLVSRNLPVSRYSAADYPQLKRTTVIYGGVDTNRYRPSVTEPRTRTALFVGRVIPMKGVDVLVQAVAPSMPLTIIGPAYNAGYMSELQRLAIGKAVTFRPPPCEDDLIEAFQTARAVVLPSVYESAYGPRERAELFPLVLLEAMACGTPVVCSRAGGMPELVEDGVNGFVVEQHDETGLHDRIQQLLADDRLWREMSRNALDTVRARFTWPLVAERCLQAYGL